MIEIRITTRVVKIKDAKEYNKLIKGVWRMPRLSEAKKDVISCDKLRGFAHKSYIRRFPNGATHYIEDIVPKGANPVN